MNFLFNINVCRVCMQNDQSSDLWNDKELLEAFIFTTRLAVTEKDNLPKVMCTNCTVRLRIAHKFIKTAHESEKNLKKFLAKISTEFIEVTQGNKPDNKSLKYKNLTDAEILALVEDEDPEKVTNAKFNSNNTENIIEKRKLSPIPEHGYKKYKNDSKHVIEASKTDNVLLEESSNSKNEETEDLLLIHADNAEIEFENDTNLIETQDDDTEQEDVEEEEHEIHINEDDEEQEDDQSDKSLRVNEESQPQSQLNDLTLDASPGNPHEIHHVDNDGCLLEYETMIQNQVDSLQYQTYYVDENSVEEVTLKEDSFYVHNPDEEEHDDDDDDKPHESIIKPTSANGRDEILSKPLVRKRIHIHRLYCEKCNRDFSTKTNLNRHMQSHEGNKPFACTVCDKSFTQNSTLKQHMYTHTGERPYVCDVCNRGFTQSKSLIFHMRRHTGEKPFQCEYCLITFRQKDALRIHILKHHVIIEQTSSGNELFTCIICQKKFDTKTEFKTHMKAHTASAETNNIELIRSDQEEFSLRKTKNQNNTNSLLMPLNSECVDAAVVNVSSSSAAEPGRAKKFQCRKCFKCFALKKSFIRHMRIHSITTNEELSECLDCDLQFSSIEGYQEHFMELHQYACSSCPELIFKTIQDLKMHMFDHELEQQDGQEQL